MHDSEGSLQITKNRRLPLAVLLTLVAFGECFIVSAAMVSRGSGISALPTTLLSVVLVLFHLLPLTSARTLILVPIHTEADASIWRLVTTYLAMDAVEKGLILLLGHH